MSQFQGSEIKYKDFKKSKISKFDPKTDSFIHWYKLFCTTCLQWGIWCPPYESTKKDHIHGSWWTSLPGRIRANESFMSSLIYAMLAQENLFPLGSKEYGAIHGCPPNAGYHAIYSLLRLHHPLLHSVLSTANEIPRQRRTESFSSFIRRLQDFIARERVANRKYIDEEALDLAVRNLLPEWRTEFRRMVERDRRARPTDPFPFKHSMSQIATTFVEYAIEIGREPPSLGSSAAATGSSRANPLIINRLESLALNDDRSPSPDNSSPTFPTNDGMELILRVIDQRQEASTVCIGCQQPGHTLTDCHRFVDYVIAQKLADLHPQLKARVAATHSQFRSRPRPALRGRESNPNPRVHRIENGPPIPVNADDSPFDAVSPALLSSQDDLPFSPDDCQQNAIRVGYHDDPLPADNDPSFSHSVNSVVITPASTWSDTISVALPHDSDNAPEFLLRRLANTFDATTGAVHAHADNGSMTCTTNDATLLFSYRLLSESPVRLFDAGQHIHRPIGIGFLKVPTQPRCTHDTNNSIFVETYHTDSIPGVIISHSSIAKQLSSDGYHMSSWPDRPGFIHFPSPGSLLGVDVFISLQPTDLRGGLTFTDALIRPSLTEHSNPMLLPAIVAKLSASCTDHLLPVSSDYRLLLDPSDGFQCNLCHLPPPDPVISDFR
jgi:hypothetical protein